MSVQVSLVYGNLTVDDILLRKELDELQAKHPDQLKVCGELGGGRRFCSKAMSCRPST